MTGSAPLSMTPEAAGLVMTVGEILVEVMATTKGDGFLEPQPLVGPFASGAPAIFIDQVAKLGAAAGIVASVGADDFGRLNIERLRRDGVDVSAIAVSKRLPTGSAFVRYRPDGARDFVYNIGQSAAGEVALTEEARRMVERARHLHIMGSALSLPGVEAVLDHALTAIRASGGSFSFDPNVRKELLSTHGTGARFAALVDGANLLLPSGDELMTAAGVDSEADAVKALFARGVGEIALKRGAAGSTFYGADGTRIDCAGFRVSEVDPTGAGDCFGAAYVTCRRRGMDPHKSLYYANAAGARNVTKQGPMEGVGSFAQLDEFIHGTVRA